MENSCRKNLKQSSKKWVIASVYPKFRRNLCLRSTNADLYHYAGNCPVRYIDPDGRITKHKDKKGAKRVLYELGDCLGGTLKTGIFVEASAKVYGVCGVNAEVNLGSSEVSQSLSNVKESKDSCGVSLSLDVAEVASAGISIERSTTDTKNDKSLSDAIFNAWKNGETEVSPIFSICIPNTTSVEDLLNVKKSVDGSADDVKAGVSVGFGMGVGVWVNISELKDFISIIFNGDF